jgi:hypothetical protein
MTAHDEAWRHVVFLPPDLPENDDDDMGDDE